MPRPLRLPVPRGYCRFSARTSIDHWNTTIPQVLPVISSLQTSCKPTVTVSYPISFFSTSSGRSVEANAFLPSSVCHKPAVVAPHSAVYPSPLTSSIFSTAARPARRLRSRVSPLSQVPKRYCSYRRMCHSRRADGSSGSTSIAASREVLPTNVKPRHYDLTLEPDFEKFTFEGTVIIEYV